MRKINISCILAICLLLTACNGNVSDTESQVDSNSKEIESSEKESGSESESVSENVVMKEVVFLNRMYSKSNMEFESWDGGYSGIHIMLDWDIEYDEDTLFAYTVGWNHCDEEDNIIDVIDILERNGFYILQEYPNERIVIAAKPGQLSDVFVYAQLYEGYYLSATSAMRPDMEDIIKEYCGAENYDDSKYEYEWFEENFEELVPLLGTDKNYVKLTVPVLVPEDN